MGTCEKTPCGAFIAISISFMSRPLHSLTQLEPKGEDVSIQPRWKKKKKKGKKNPKHKTQGLWQVSALTNPQKGKREGGSKKKKKKRKPALFNCGTSIKASKWGRLGGTLAHQTDTPNTHHLYAGLLKKRKIKVSADEKRPVPCIYLPPPPPPPPSPPPPSFFFFFFTKLRKRGFSRHVKRT